MRKPKRPILLLSILSFVLLLLAGGGIYGGYHLILDPSGGLLNMPLSALEQTPFPNYTIPGYILLFGYGFGGLISIYGLWSRAPLPLLSPLARWTHEYWAWDLSLALGVGLIIWLTYQAIFYRAFAPIQLGMYGVAILLIGLPLLDPLKAYFYEDAR